jgi:predicted Zn-dependent peptidase
MAGDLDPEKTIKLIDQYFGEWEATEVPEFSAPEPREITEPIFTEVYGQQAEHVYIGFPYGGAKSEEAPYLLLIDELMSNGSAGIIDININKKQKLLRGSSFRDIRNDYSAHMFYGMPKEGQSLDEVRDILLEQVETLKSGDFDEWLVEATINKLKLDRMKTFEGAGGQAFSFVNAFIEEKEWEDYVNEIEALEKITKKDIVKFANEKYGENYVVVYKRKGDPDRHKVEKPEITPVVVNRDTSSEFMQYLSSLEGSEVEPKFIDFDKAIKETSWKEKVTLSFIENEKNDRFELYFIFDIGTDHDLELAEGVRLLEYLGTDKFSPEDFQRELFKYGLSFNVSTSDDYVYVSLSGLEDNLEKGVELMEHLIQNAVPDNDAYQSLVARTAKSRADAKTDKGTILRSAMYNYGVYGDESPYLHRLSIEEMEGLDPTMLTEKVHDLPNYKHRVFYYGTKGLDYLTEVLSEKHSIPDEWNPVPEPAEFAQLPTEENKVYFVHFDMVQAEMMILTRSETFNTELMGPAYLFNSYFGAGLSSIVFQEIREQKALAYSAYSFYTSPGEKDEHHYLRAYVGTQADKLGQASDAMLELLGKMPYVDMQYEASRDAALKNIATDWITGTSIYWNRETARKRGLDYDIRKDIYTAIEDMEFGQLEEFFNAEIAGKPRNFLVLGNREMVDQTVLEQLGEVKELTLEEIFGY